PSRGEDSGEAVEISGADEAALEVTLLRPGVGIEEGDFGQRRRGEPVEEADGVAVEKANVAQAEIADAGHRLCHAVLERLYADEADILAFRCCGDQSLSAAEADLESDLIHRDWKNRAQINRARGS